MYFAGFGWFWFRFCAVLLQTHPQNPKQMTSSSKSPSFNGTRLTFGSFFLRLRPAIWCSTSRSGVSTSIGMKAQKPEQLATVPTWKLKGYTKLGQNLEVIDGLPTFLWMLGGHLQIFQMLLFVKALVVKPLKLEGCFFWKWFDSLKSQYICRYQIVHGMYIPNNRMYQKDIHYLQYLIPSLV